ncbi:hypothetical protein RND81_08G145200 [Saponaria officinalis]|uniref:RING-type domain-containing protein n=1 Tax=Saponaria officinalis TaxID=3572 RepID=A0AAW1J7B4_SAPOF
MFTLTILFYIALRALNYYYRHYIGPSFRPVDLEEVVVSLDAQKTKEVTKNCTNCVICMEKLDDNNKEEYECKWIVKQCGHKFHGACLRKWFNIGKLNCPICRISYAFRITLRVI